MSQITIVNHTPDTVHIAVYKEPVLQRGEPAIAWRIATPPPNGGSQILKIPETMSVVARYSSDPAKPAELDEQTAPVSFGELTAQFVVVDAREPSSTLISGVVEQRFDRLVLNEVRVQNLLPIGCEVSLRKDDDALFLPMIVWPGSLLIEDVRGPYYVAVVTEFVERGGRLDVQEISLTALEIPEGSRVTVTGSKWDGYVLTLA